MKYDLGHVEVHKRNRMPHWQAEHAIYFVTFNLFDAIPLHARIRIREEADAQIRHIRALRGELTLAEKQAIDAWVHAKLGEALDEPHGACFLRDARVASIAAEAIQHFDRQRYLLYAWSVMPNHAHVVLSLFENVHIDRVLHSWKSYSAKAANALLGRDGTFWQDGYHDRCIRDSAELQRTIGYVLANPDKAGLKDWPFVRSYPDRIPV